MPEIVTMMVSNQTASLFFNTKLTKLFTFSPAFYAVIFSKLTVYLFLICVILSNSKEGNLCEEIFMY